MALAYPKTVNLFSEAEIRGALRRQGYMSFTGKPKKKVDKLSPFARLIKAGYKVQQISRDANGRSFMLLDKPQGHLSMIVILYP